MMNERKMKEIMEETTEEFCTRCHQSLAGVDPDCERLEIETLSLEFLKLMDDIGKYGVEKYGELSFERLREAGELTRDHRTYRSSLLSHARVHANEYADGVKHDHFHTEEHQLAAAAFNLMMEYIYTKESK